MLRQDEKQRKGLDLSNTDNHTARLVLDWVVNQSFRMVRKVRLGNYKNKELLIKAMEF